MHVGLRIAIVVAIALCAPIAATVGGITQVIAYRGATLPSGSGAFQGFSSPTVIFLPSINDAGQIAFAAQTTNTGFSPDGVFRADSSHVEQVADKNQKILVGPVQTPIDFYYAPVSINANGNVGYRVNIQDPSPLASRLVLYDGTANRVMPVSGGSPALNDAGQLASIADSGIVIASTSGVVAVANYGAHPPGTPASNKFMQFASPAISDDGQVAFIATVGTGSVGGTTTNGTGMYRGNGTGSLTLIALANQTAPGGATPFGAFYEPSINGAGDVAFTTFGGRGESDSVYITHGAAFQRVARVGDVWPDGIGTLTGFGNPAINDLGETAFATGTTIGKTGILMADGTGLHQVARLGQTAPGGAATFGFFETDVAFNDAGKVLFEGQLSGGGGISGLFLGSRDGTILEIARTGQSLLGSTISALDFSPSNAREGSGLRGLNSSGQVAYYFRLADGRDGIALWSIPEPSGCALMGIAMLAFARRRGSRRR